MNWQEKPDVESSGPGERRRKDMEKQRMKRQETDDERAR
jgi:hypothetical protein